LSKIINKKYGLPFLFITAYNDSRTIDRAVDSTPIGYLVKPIKQHEVYAAIALTLKSLSSSNKTNAEKSNLKQEEDSIENQTHVFVKSGFNINKIPIDKIVYIQSFKNYIEINQTNSKILIRKKLGDFLDSLANDSFLQVHRSYVVNLNYIEEISEIDIKLESKIIPLSKHFKKDLKLKFLK
jgi:DNA-binding LytR/AlgR family response regulator